MPCGNVKLFEFCSGADTLHVSSAAKRPMLLGGSLRLQLENFLDDFLDVNLLRSWLRSASLTVTPKHLVRNRILGQPSFQLIRVWK